MFTAKDFLRKPDFRTLPGLIRTDPGRLKREFLEVAEDFSEPYLFRTKSLRILNIHARALGGYSSSDGADLIAAFEREFPAERLSEIATALRLGLFHFDCWMVYLYCVALAAVAPVAARDHIDMVLKLFKGTFREASLNIHLELITRRRWRDS